MQIDLDLSDFEKERTQYYDCFSAVPFRSADGIVQCGFRDI